MARRDSIFNIAFGVIFGLLGAGLLFLISQKPQGDPIKLNPPPTPQPIIVHVAGAVKNPGVYSLTIGSRVQDAIAEAGGLSPEANPQKINLAAYLIDGNRILIPTHSIDYNPHENNTSISTLQIPSQINPRININTATQAELESLPYLNPEYAASIIAYRETYGAFDNIEDILDVDGINSKIFENIKYLITVENYP